MWMASQPVDNSAKTRSRGPRVSLPEGNDGACNSEEHLVATRVDRAVTDAHRRDAQVHG